MFKTLCIVQTFFKSFNTVNDLPVFAHLEPEWNTKTTLIIIKS